MILILIVGACKKTGDQAETDHIKPVFASTYLGGSGHEFCEAIALDAAGNIYIAGNTYALDFPTTEGAYNREHRGKSDVFLAKFDNNLETLLASTLIGGSEGENAYTILFDSRGFVYVAGYTTSTDFPTTAQAYDTQFNGGDGDAFLLKMDKDLKTLVSSTYLGGSGAENDWRSPELVQDGEGNIYIAGNTASEDFPTTTGVFQEKYNGGRRDVFLSKFDPGLARLLASTLLGGSADESLGRSLCIDLKDSEILVGGYTFSPDFPTSQNALGREVSGQLDGFISKLSLDLTTLNASTILDAGWIYSLMLHENGDIYVGGHAVDRLPTTPGAFYQTFDKASDQGFVTRLSNDLTELKSSTVLPGRYSSGGGRICSLNLCQSPDGGIFTSGWARPIDFPITPGVFDETQNGLADTYIMKMDKDLSQVLLSTFVGGSRSERWNRMILDGAGNIYIASYSLSSNFPTSPNAAFRNFGDEITDEIENLNTSVRDTTIIKIDGDLTGQMPEELHEAAKGNRVKELQRLLRKDENLLEKRDKYQRTPLHSASRFNALDAAVLLLDQGADLSAKDESDNTPLHLASIFSHNEIIERLIQHKADVNVLNSQGQTPLHLASIYGNAESIESLLANGADVKIKDADGNTALHTAVLFRRPVNLAAILKTNPEVDVTNNAQNTPLHLAVQRPENQESVEHLLQYGADVNFKDPSGRNALLITVASVQTGYIEILASKGVDINSQDNEGNTALHYVLNRVLENKSFMPMIKLIAAPLLKEGADPHIKNRNGKSPVDLAEESGEKELIDLLKSSKSQEIDSAQ